MGKHKESDIFLKRLKGIQFITILTFYLSIIYSKTKYNRLFSYLSLQRANYFIFMYRNARISNVI